MADAFNALSDPTRRAILVLLSGRQLPAGEIAGAFRQQRPAISKHLAVLKEAGILEETRDRQRRLYSIRRGALEPVSGLIRRLRPCEDPHDVPTLVAGKPIEPQSRPPRRSYQPFDLDID